MTEVQTTIYRCAYCRKYGIRKHAIIEHEKYCAKNPANAHVCFTCQHLTVERTDNKDGGFNEKTFTCEALGLELHSFKAEKVKHSCLGHTTRMPLKCQSYQGDYGFAAAPQTERV